jgi:hypothetical protein
VTVGREWGIRSRRWVSIRQVSISTLLCHTKNTISFFWHVKLDASYRTPNSALLADETPIWAFGC